MQLIPPMKLLSAMTTFGTKKGFWAKFSSPIYLQMWLTLFTAFTASSNILNKIFLDRVSAKLLV